MNKVLEFIFRFDYWKNVKRELKLKKALSIFFNEEDADLQALFHKNFNYPDDMVNNPVRYDEDSGIIYYVINLASKELFYNEETLQTAIAQSLSILQENLPIGCTDYITPSLMGQVENSFSVLISLEPTIEDSLPKNIAKMCLFHLAELLLVVSPLIYFI